MATWPIKGYQRVSKKGLRYSVNDYTQNRPNGTPRIYVKKGYTACQTDIAEVIKRDLPTNATVDNLRGSHAWRNYVCNCKDSNVYDIATTGVAGPGSWYRNNPVKGADFVYIDKKGKRRVVKGIIANYSSFVAHSKCGVDVVVPAFRRPMSGKEIIKIKGGA